MSCKARRNPVTVQNVAESSPHPTSGGMSTVSWMTLFYDLIIVAVFARATYIYGKDPSWMTFAFIAVSLIVLYALWSITNLELVMSPDTSWRRRIVVLVQVVALLVCGLAMYRGGGISDRWGFLALCVAFLSTAALTWLRKREATYDARWMRTLMFVSLGASAIFALGACFPMGFLVGDVLIAWIFYPVAAVWVAVGFAVIIPRLLVSPTSIDAHPLNERFGVLLLIVLGDAFLQLLEVLGAMRSIPAPEFLVFTLLFVIAIWLLYFPMLGDPPLAATIRLARSRVAAHFLLVLSSAFGIVAYVELSTGFSEKDADGTSTAWTTIPMLGVGVAVLWLTWIESRRWTSAMLTHTLAVAILLVLTVSGEITNNLGREIDLVVANLVLLAAALAVLVQRRRARARANQ